MPFKLLLPWLQASGFCYVNDLVLGILELLKVPPVQLFQFLGTSLFQGPKPYDTSPFPRRNPPSCACSGLLKRERPHLSDRSGWEGADSRSPLN